MEALTIEIDKLKLYPNNPRISDIQPLIDSLKNNGQYKPIVVQKSTNQIIAGNHIWQAAKQLNWTMIDIVYADVDDDQAKKIVVADNRYSDLGSYDTQKLLDLLSEIDIQGSGYSSEDVDDLLAELDESMPEIATDEEKHYEGIATKPTLAERAQRYAERTIRLLMAEYPNHEYVWLQDKLTGLRDKYSVESNAEAILKVIEEVTGEKAPTS